MSTKNLLQFSTAGIILATLLIFFPPFANAFIGDDYVQLDYVLEFVSRPYTLYKVFNPTWTSWYYRPLQNLWFLGNRTLFHFDPFGYYWLGLLVHGLAIAMFVGLARKMGLRWETAVAGGALFAIHKHYVDVVTWISAIAIPLAGLFAMATLAAYITYLRHRNGRALRLTLLLFLLALLSHEEAVLLLPLLLLWRLLSSEPATGWAQRLRALRRQISQAEVGAFGLMALITAAYLLVQGLRPNLTISLAEDSIISWQLFSPLVVSQFVVASLGRLLPNPDLAATLLPYSLAVALLTGAALAFWFWRGSRVEKLGLAWGVLHLAFIYAALWTPKPELYAGRHIYQAWIGLALAVSAALPTAGGKGIRLPTRKSRRGGHGRFRLNSHGLLIVLLLLASIGPIHAAQANWVAETAEEMAAREQIRALLPEVDETMHIFAFRFPITPNFLRSVLQVWYDRDEPYRQPFGPLPRLQAHGEANPNFYMLDWDETGRLYNLMPELQNNVRTVFIWSRPVQMEIVQGETVVPETGARQILTIEGPPDDRRMAVLLEPPQDGGWRALDYALTIPAGGVLETAVRRGGAEGGGLSFRVRILHATGEETLLDMEILAGDEKWHEVQIPLTSFEETAVTLRLEVSGTGIGHWANPRLTN